MKKIALGLSVVMLLVNILSVSASASSISGMVVNTANAGAQSVEIWNEIDVPVKIDQNPGAAMFSYDVKFDSSVLEYVSCESAGNAAGDILAAGLAGGRNDLIRIVGSFGKYDEDSNKTGTVAVLKFRAIGVGTGKVSVNAAGSYAMRTDGTAITVTTSVSASVTVTKGNTVVSAGKVADVAEHWLVTIPVRITTNPGIAGYVIDVTYNEKCLEFVRCENGTVIENLLACGPHAGASQSAIRVVGAQADDTMGDGVLFNLLFTVKEGASREIAVKIGPDSSLLNADGQAVAFAGQAGAVVLKGGSSNAGDDIDSDTVEHIVVTGDCLWNLAVKYYGNGAAYTKIMEANNIKNADRIYVGQKLIIPA